MRWWLAAHKALVVLVLVFGTSATALATARLNLALPALSGSMPFAPVPLVAVLATLATVIVAAGLSSGDEAIVRAAARNAHALNAAYLFGAFAVVGLTSAMALPLGVPVEHAWLLLRDTAGCLALLVVGRTLALGRYSATVPTGYLLASSIFGRTSGGLPAWWAWPLQRGEEADLPVLILSAAAAVVLLVECGRRGRAIALGGQR
ncbi:hypothetical protein [Sinomonas sp. ASV322]|uniref:hypothetical protein n=1 Tax=Sinomonas sp. ASV322 TaxID=3041920 RepID=UPI0027DBAD9F|nr:hypothetical protein [Sinomonas sp. ASV322]MDQ4502646.1 hypothetical protein [Sinomonas sp. ASV322]